jgi:phosphatidate cytidylyltransferase
MIAGLYEFWWLARKREMRPDVVVGFAAAAALFIAFYFNDLSLIIPILLLFTMAALAAAMLRGSPFDKMIASTGATLLGVFYVVLLGGHLVALRTSADPFLGPHAADLLSFFFLIIMGSDTGAYYTGRALGRHKLAPNISPGKTWEGAVGGMLASLLMAAVAHFWFFPELSLNAALPLAAVMNVLGVMGDLTESALKRGAGAKDAAQILPGHGGFLDRLDSLLFNAPLIYYFGLFYFRP